MSVFVNNEKSRKDRVKVKLDSIVKYKASGLQERVKELAKNDLSLLTVKKSYLKNNEIILNLKNAKQPTALSTKRKRTTSILNLCHSK